MAASKEPQNLDSQFYKPADAFFPAYHDLGLTHDDVTLATLYSEILPRDTQIHTTLAAGAAKSSSCKIASGTKCGSPVSASPTFWSTRK